MINYQRLINIILLTSLSIFQFSNSSYGLSWSDSFKNWFGKKPLDKKTQINPDQAVSIVPMQWYINKQVQRIYIKLTSDSKTLYCLTMANRQFLSGNEVTVKSCNNVTDYFVNDDHTVASPSGQRYLTIMKPGIYNICVGTEINADPTSEHKLPDIKDKEIDLNTRVTLVPCSKFSEVNLHEKNNKILDSATAFTYSLRIYYDAPSKQLKIAKGHQWDFNSSTNNYKDTGAVDSDYTPDDDKDSRCLWFDINDPNLATKGARLYIRKCSDNFKENPNNLPKK